MNKHTLSPADRIAALEEQNARLSDRNAMAQQMQVCALARDKIADQLNAAIDERDELRSKVAELEARIVELLKKQNHE